MSVSASKQHLLVLAAAFRSLDFALPPDGVTYNQTALAGKVGSNRSNQAHRRMPESWPTRLPGQ